MKQAVKYLISNGLTKYSGVGGAIVCLLAFCLITLSSADLMAQDSATVRIRVDIDNVSLTVDEVLVELDSYGNKLNAEAYFILQLVPGSKNLSFSHPDYELITRSVTLVAGEVTSLEIRFIADTVQVGSSIVKLASIPDSAEITIDGITQSGVAPQEFDLVAGEHTIELILPGYEPLSHTITLTAETIVTLEFLLRAIISRYPNT